MSEVQTNPLIQTLQMSNKLQIHFIYHIKSKTRDIKLKHMLHLSPDSLAVTRFVLLDPWSMALNNGACSAPITESTS